MYFETEGVFLKWKFKNYEIVPYINQTRFLLQLPNLERRGGLKMFEVFKQSC